jgi:glycerophosphoryl diester phosphodiesterase
MAKQAYRYYDAVPPRPGAPTAVFDAPHPLVFAHRGGAGLAPENTLVAFQHGLALGADGLELDVHLSRDGDPVVIHDRTVDRTTNGRGAVAEMSTAALAGLDAAAHFGAARGFPFRDRGYGVPTLAAVLTACPTTRVIIEMKQGTAALAAAVVAVVRRMGAEQRVCLGSFQQEALDAARRLAPEVATSASQREARWTMHRGWVRWPFGWRAPYVAFQVPAVAGRLRVVTPAFLAQAHRDGRRVQVWVVNDDPQATSLLDIGADGLVTDRPDLAVPIRDRWYARRSAHPR